MRLVQKKVQKQLESLSLDGVLRHLGFKEINSESHLPEWIALKHPKNKELLLLYLSKDGLRYKNPARSDDFGDVMDFMLNHHHQFLSETSNQNLWESSYDWLLELTEQKLKGWDAVTNLEQSNSPEHFFLQGLQAPNMKVYGKWGIGKEILEQPLFANRIFSKGETLVFPVQDKKGKVIGNLLQEQTASFHEYGDTGKGIWLSNTTKTQKQLFVVEHPLEALSHYALFPNQDILYVALPGTLHREQLDFLEKLAKEQQFKKIFFGFSNSQKGLVLDYGAIANVLSEELPIVIKKDLEGEKLIITLHPSDKQQEQMQQLFQKIKKFNVQQRQDYDRLFSLEHSNTLQKGVIRMVPLDKGQGFRLQLPLHSTILKFGLWALSKVFGLQQRKLSVSYVKSLDQTWNTDLIQYLNNKNKKQIEENMRKTAS